MEPPEEYIQLKKEFEETIKPEKLFLKDLPSEEYLDLVKNNDTFNFLYNFVSSWRNNYITIDELGNEVTGLERRTSLSETFQIIKTYFPEYNTDQFFKDLVLPKLKINSFFLLLFCKDIQKNVIYQLIEEEYYYTPNRNDISFRIASNGSPNSNWVKSFASNIVIDYILSLNNKIK